MLMVANVRHLEQKNEYPRALCFYNLAKAQLWVKETKEKESQLSNDEYIIFHVPHPDYNDLIPLVKMPMEQLFEKRDELEKFSLSLIYEIANKKFVKMKQKYKQLFVDNKIDLAAYPKISEAFGFENL